MSPLFLLLCMSSDYALGQPDKAPSPDRYVKVKTDVEPLPSSIEAKYRQPERTILLVDRILFGAQFKKPEDCDAHGHPDKDFSRLPGWYFHPDGPAGIVMRKFDWFPGKLNTFQADARLPASLIGHLSAAPGFSSVPMNALAVLWSEPPYAILGVDSGNLACYARPAQTVHCIDRIPLVVELCTTTKDKPAVFTYIEDARNRGACISLEAGELRPSLEKRKVRGFYHAMFIQPHKDGENGVQKELLTKEGMALCMDAMAEEGILCYHTSSRYYDFPTIIADVAKSLGFACSRGHDTTEGRDELSHFTSEWVMVARKTDYLSHLVEPKGYKGRFGPYWQVPDPTGKFSWTDAGKNSMKGAVRSDPRIGSFHSLLFELETYIGKTGISPGAATRIRELIQPIHRLIDIWGESVARNRDY